MSTSAARRSPSVSCSGRDAVLRDELLETESLDELYSELAYGEPDLYSFSRISSTLTIIKRCGARELGDEEW